MRALLLLVLLLGFAATAHAGCRVEPRDTVPLDLANGHILVTVRVKDIPLAFILDTGAERTLIGEDVVRTLGLKRDSWVASTVRGIGGIEQRPNALPRSLRLGNTVLRRRTVTADTSVTVGPLPLHEAAGRPIAGLLGRDFLSPFDLDIDLPNHRVTLYEIPACAGRLPPWTAPFLAIPAAMPAGKALVVQVLVDGVPLRALVDTGASASLITARGMVRLGLTPAVLEPDPGVNASGIGLAPVPMHRHRFDRLSVGPIVVSGPTSWVAPVHVVPIVDILLGADWLGTRHVWLSFATLQMFVTMPGHG